MQVPDKYVYAAMVLGFIVGLLLFVILKCAGVLLLSWWWILAIPVGVFLFTLALGILYAASVD